jgi:hypothetical protein
MKTMDLNDIKTKFDEFYEQQQKEETAYLLRNVKVAAPDVDKNYLDEKKTILFFENDKNALKEYFDLVVSTRPEMVKEEKTEFAYDWDFDVDVNNYDPWQEYKMIYRDLFTKGRAYFIIKSIPEWKFLQVGTPVSNEEDSFSQFNPKRPNNRDSIFSMLTIDKYFHERMTKEGLSKDKSQAIRI